MRNRLSRVAALAAAAFFLCAASALAQEDGFVTGHRVPGEHITILCESGVDLAQLTAGLRVGPADRLLVSRPDVETADAHGALAEAMETIFLRVCDVLDMRLYRFQGTVKVCRTQEALNQVYASLFSRDLGSMRSFYWHATNTVYTSAENFTRGVIGHELAHAIISAYFVVLPSVKIQEVLAAYVEYQLRKGER